MASLYSQENSISIIFTGKINKIDFINNHFWVNNKDYFINNTKKHIHQYIFNELFKENPFESFVITDNTKAKEIISKATEFELKPDTHIDVKKRISSIEFLLFNKKEFFLIINFNNFGRDYITNVSDYWNLFFSMREYFKFTNVFKILKELLIIDNKTKIDLNGAHGDELQYARFKIFSQIILNNNNTSMYSDIELKYILSCATNGNTFENVSNYNIDSISLYSNNYLSISQEGACNLTAIRKNISFYKNGKHRKIFKDLKMAYHIFNLQYCFMYNLKEAVVRSCDKKKVDLKKANKLSEELIYFTTNYRYTSISSFEYLDKAYWYILERNNFKCLLQDVEKSVEPLFDYHNKKKNLYITRLLQFLGLIATTYTSYNIYKIIIGQCIDSWEICKKWYCNSTLVLGAFFLIYMVLLVLINLKKTSKFKILK